jgi:DNA-directed RNA polymerase specialized sigma24 family protein
VEQRQSPHPRWDEEVCERLVAGDEAALRELSDEFSPLVYGLAARVTRDWAAAEDISQEVFVHVWNDPRAFDPARGTWRGWLGILTHRRPPWRTPRRRRSRARWPSRSRRPLTTRSPRSARLVLVGPGGGDWTISPAVQEAPTRPPDTTVTMGALDFCYLLGNRRDPDSVPDRVEGDPVVAATLLRAAITLGCD